MSVWKEAFWLTEFELKHAYRQLIFQFGILLIAFMFVVPSIPNYLEKAFMGVDFQFLIVFAIFGHAFRPKPFKIDQIRGEFFASAHLIMLQGLPTAKETIVKYRFITCFIVSFIFNCLFLIGLYLLTPVLREVMTPSIYLAFSIIWLCYSVFIGGIQLLYEVYSHRLIGILTSLFVLGPLLLILDAILFYKVYSNGLVGWVIMIANNYPILASSCSIIFALFGWNLLMYRMRRRMEKTDYV